MHCMAHDTLTSEVAFKVISLGYPKGRPYRELLPKTRDSPLGIGRFLVWQQGAIGPSTPSLYSETNFNPTTQPTRPIIRAIFAKEADSAPVTIL